MRLPLVAALLAICANLVSAAPPPEYVCRVTATPPQLDGRLDDACWQSAEAGFTCTELGIGGRAARNVTTTRLLMDRSALYVAVDAETAPGVRPAGQDRGRDGHNWSDDAVELMLAPSFTEEGLIQLALGAYGSPTDLSTLSGTPPDGRLAWNGTWEARTVTRTGGWAAELRLPWSDLGLKGAPPTGWVLRMRLGCTARGFPNSMWPRTETQSFHDPACWGYLILGDRNLQPNADFEAGVPEKGAAVGYSYAYYPAEGEGVCSVTTEDHVSGRHAGKLQKTDDKAWFPVFYTAPVPLQPGSTYELSALVKCDREYVMRYNLAGASGAKRSANMPPTKGWERVRTEATIPASGVDSLTYGFQLIRTKGVILLDDVMIRRLNDVTGMAASEVVPHPYHRLEELSQRTAFKPYDLLQRADGSYQADRVIFRDTGTGATIWLLARSAGSSTRHTYMEISPWNCDGSLLLFNSGQVGRGSALMDPATGRWRSLPFYASSPIWDRREPRRVYFRSYRGHEQTDLWDLAWGDVVTGKCEIGRRFDGDIGLWPMSQDGEKLLVRETLVGADGKQYTHVWLMNRDVRDGLRLDPHGLCHQTWFMKRPDYSVEFEWEGQTPAGQYCLTTDGKVRQMFPQTTGHRAHSPDGKWVAVMAGCGLRDKDTGALKLIGDVSSDHQTWETDPNWYATSSGRYLRRVVAFGPSPTVQLLGAHNSALRHSTYWTEAHPEMSPDGTKLGYASSMMGDPDFYFLVMRQPDAPRELRAQAAGAAVKLTWQPGQYHAEAKGYLVYRARRSGEWGDLVQPEPVAALTLTDNPPFQPAYYRVTAVDQTGLESLPAGEVCSRTPWAGSAAVYVEAESGQYEAPAAEVFDPRAAGLYAVGLGQLRVGPPLRLKANAPVAGQYRLWLRARSPVATTVGLAAAGKPLGEAKLDSREYAWVAGDKPLTLNAGEQMLSLAAQAPGVVVDRVLLATDAALTPVGRSGLDETAPAMPAGLSATAAGSYAVRLRWTPVAEADVTHYQVYCGAGADFAAGQERLVGSPGEAEFVDWGLRAGQTYYYRVSAVDRAGNESPACPAVALSTPALTTPVARPASVTWDTTQQARLELPFTLARDTSVVLWGKVQSLDGETRAPLKLLLDGKELPARGISFSYICVGHGGPVLKTWLWTCFRPAQTGPGQPLAFAAPAGAHTLTLQAAPETKVRFEDFVLTDDLGYVPEGLVNFLVRPDTK